MDKIAVDAMGGDFAPLEIVKGAVLAVRDFHVPVVLVGDKEQIVKIEITDHGIGIPDVKKAMEPMYTTKPEEERTGMGFSFMEAFMDQVEVISKQGEGTTVIMTKKIGDQDKLNG